MLKYSLEPIRFFKSYSFGIRNSVWKQNSSWPHSEDLRITVSWYTNSCLIWILGILPQVPLWQLCRNVLALRWWGTVHHEKWVASACQTPRFFLVILQFDKVNFYLKKKDYRRNTDTWSLDLNCMALLKQFCTWECSKKPTPCVYRTWNPGKLIIPNIAYIMKKKKGCLNVT